jgi:hypothetical protein
MTFTPTPADNAVEQPVDSQLVCYYGPFRWIINDLIGGPPAPFPPSIRLCFGPTNPPPVVLDGKPGYSWGQIHGDVGPTIRYDPGPLNFDTTYYWQVTVSVMAGYNVSPMFSFRTVVPIAAAVEESIRLADTLTADPIATALEHVRLAETVTAGLSVLGDDVATVLTTTSTSTQNDFNPGTLGIVTVLRANNASPLTLTGLAAPATDGAMLWIESIGAGQVDIKNQDSGSTAANRVINNVTGTISLAAGSGRALLCYDATTARWRVLEHEQGAWIDVSYSAGDFTGGGSMTVTPGGAPSTYRYWLKGRTLHFELTGVNWSIAGTPSAAINVTIPGGFSAAAFAVWMTFKAKTDSGTSIGVAYVESATPTKISFFGNSTAVQTWALSTNNSGVECAIAFDVQ